MLFKPFFTYCIYCDVELPIPEKRTGDGEHIIPKNIFGFWKSRDVCDACVKYFNESIDALPLKNLEIINAVKSLGLDDKKVFENNLRYEGIDLYNNQRVNFITKKGKPIIKSISSNTFSQYKEEDFYTLGIGGIRKDRKKYLSHDVLDNELLKLKEMYKNAKYGDLIESNVLKVKVRKSTAKVHKLDKTNLQLLAPLIAKIDIAAIFMIIPWADHCKIREFDLLRKYLRYGGKLPENFITYLPRGREVQYEKFHIIRMRFFDRLFLLDVCLFGYPNWKTSFHVSEKIIYKPLPKEPDLEFDEIKWVLDFENLNNRKFHIILKNTNTNIERSFESK